MIGSLGFWYRGVFIGEEARQGAARAATPKAWARVSRVARGCGPLVAPLRLVFWLRVPHTKILTLAFLPSNSENIDFLPFLEPKKEENGQLALWHLVNRLVSESV